MKNGTTAINYPLAVDEAFNTLKEYRNCQRYKYLQAEKTLMSKIRHFPLSAQDAPNSLIQRYGVVLTLTFLAD